MEVMVTERVNLADLPAHLAKHRLYAVRLEHWREHGWLLVTERIEDDTTQMQQAHL